MSAGWIAALDARWHLLHIGRRAAATALTLVLLTPSGAFAQTAFVDEFNRPDGPVANGWSNTTGNVGGDLLIRGGALGSPDAPGGEAGIYRPADLSQPLSASFTTSHVSGFGGIPFRYIPTIRIGSDGILGNGYGIMPYRGDVNYPSKVLLMLNGLVLDERLSSFQFQSAIDVVVTFNPDGSVSGSIGGDGNEFAFSFGPRVVTLAGANVALTLPIPDNRTAPTTYPTLDHFRLSSDQLPGTPAGPTPQDAAQLQAQPNRFDWADTPGATSYDLAVDGTLRATVATSDWTSSLSLASGVHHWQVTARNDVGTSTGPLWSFTIGSLGSPTTPSPGDNARVSAPPSLFDWSDVSGATSYEVFIDGVLVGQPTASQWPLDRQLALGTHLWRVAARGALGSRDGPTWVFYYTTRYLSFSATRFVQGAMPVLLERADSPGADIDPLLRTWIVIHGRNDSSAGSEMRDLASTVTSLRAGLGDQVLMLDWALAAAPILGYVADFSGEDWIQPVAEATASELLGYGFQRQSLHLIGHSWGSYLADELAERLNGVASIVALDPARDTPPLPGVIGGPDYNAEEQGEIDFAAHSECSWAFRSSWLGSASTPTSADQAYFVEFDITRLFSDRKETWPAEHSLIRRLFGTMARTAAAASSSVRRHFQLDRLVSCAAPPLSPDAFDDEGGRDPRGRYEGVIHAPLGVLSWIDVDGLGPSNLRVLDMMAIAGSTAVRLGWVMPALGPSVSELRLEGGFSPGATVGAIALPPASEFTVNLPDGDLFLRMRTVSDGALSEPSNELPVRVAVPAAPSAPTNLLGTANGAGLTLGWTNTFAGGTPATITLDVRGAFNGSLDLGTSESFDFAGVPPGTYTFSARASNAAGTSPPSNPVTLSFQGGCSGAPGAPRNYLAYAFGNAVSLSWDPPGGGGLPSRYELQVSGAWSGVVPTAARSINTPVPPGTYNISVVAVNACGRSAPTAIRSVRVR